MCSFAALPLKYPLTGPRLSNVESAEVRSRCQHSIDHFQELWLQRIELAEILSGKLLPHFVNIWEISRRNVVLALKLLVDLVKILNQFLLLLFLSDHRWHLLTKLSNDICVNFGKESAELLLGIDDESVSRDTSLLVTVHNRDEAVGGWLWANTDSGKVGLEKVSDERRLSGRVLSNKENHRLRVEIRII
ncbi:hypothetical protein GCK72_017883 [Caenorhabditis remanei]|uniref:Uncharacterized protein n=1 Tax=Caenorhabditis remanei TaxID=31234 RepID=A0A6A5GA20_CAERE|nr:hypothetical protein GCK72_017883 [Caenorhabditis remanei]KAF1751329.1 hypothetical protein GCK72_017883 [Caenorhabditis remanei]